jgi:hypothetical protein
MRKFMEIIRQIINLGDLTTFGGRTLSLAEMYTENLMILNVQKPFLLSGIAFCITWEN